MLNISKNSINPKVVTEHFQSFQQTSLSGSHRMFQRWLIGILITVILILFLPWTQNVQADGKVTTLRPSERPQVITTAIGGMIDTWYVQEGQLVKKGDTIVHITEVKTDYFDPDLVNRTQEQVFAKEGAIRAYNSKAVALDDQIRALHLEWQNKRGQLENKVRQMAFKITADSAAVVQSELDADIARQRLVRTQELYDAGIKSLTELEEKRLKVQETAAKVITNRNKLAESQNELANTKLALSTAEYEYHQKVAKAQSDRFATLSSLHEAEAGASKLRIQTANYAQRNNMYFITAPQDGYITQAIKAGLGEIVKEGDPILTIMPANYELAVEMYVQPMDLPLITTGQEVRFIFDGWPAFVFSGWPGQSFGTFSGNVVAIDNNISPNGSYRILVSPKLAQDSMEWPRALRPGSGARGIALLNDVPVWYEIWRQLNGFPPDFYARNKTEKEPKMKAPAKSIK
ncbi:HlyD family secretion protein [Flavilitoribacter nigricans]|uniref:Biotin attachment protein n=1 Tax=Flavilitoribacter nigricans (strain ATCC 23147 / DSM 23189 / NBRC 102662 / NCIMB 1420 / SS-2) TaxID=1122177 RepID=A0A2D0N4R7_FLAN2|nr:HlyD family efflux transporter periplasmic adaptor subunit [Flavilitoribacter nigricans]PHN03149.1 biotin attachment protein [Flavilitoribacter nigricans DSM 23189 = NBRC 102662]